MQRVLIVVLILVVVYLLYQNYEKQKEVEIAIYSYDRIMQEMRRQFAFLPDEFYDKAGKRFIRLVDCNHLDCNDLSWYGEVLENNTKKVEK